MRFLVDAQLPPALASLLRAHGHQADHVNDIGPGDAPDRSLWEFARENDAVIVTKDEDFSLLFALRGEPAAVVWVRIGNYASRRPALVVRAADRRDRDRGGKRSEAHRAPLIADLRSSRSPCR